MKARKQSAFTLVELMIVVAIIGILAALAIPGYQKLRSFSQNRTVLSNLRQLAFAAEQYLLETGASSVETSSLVGTGPDAYLRPIKPVADESYDLTFQLDTTQISTTVNGRTVTYSF